MYSYATSKWLYSNISPFDDTLTIACDFTALCESSTRCLQYFIVMVALIWLGISCLQFMSAIKANVLLPFSKEHNKLKEELIQFNWTKHTFC